MGGHEEALRLYRHHCASLTVRRVSITEVRLSRHVEPNVK
jgi:hypothetical protein